MTDNSDKSEQKTQYKHPVKHIAHKNTQSGNWIIKTSIVVIAILLLAITIQLGNINTSLEKLTDKISGMNYGKDTKTNNNNNKVNNDENKNNDQQKEVNNNENNIDMKKLADDDAVKGSEDAPVTIIEFSDFECPFCGRFYRDTLPLIKKNYIETGKVKLIYRDFPLSFHANAQKAAEAAECAKDQRKFWEMHDKLFDEGVKGGVESFKQYAKDLNLNMEEFNECLDSGKKANEVKADFIAGGEAGVRGTPAFFINGRLVSGAQPYSVFKQIIDEELSKAED